MYEFILGDLVEAEENSSPAIPLHVRPRLFPDLAVLYGLKARLYLWDASYQAEINEDDAAAATQYAEAAKYARQAITTSGATPLTQADWQSTTPGLQRLFDVVVDVRRRVHRRRCSSAGRRYPHILVVLLQRAEFRLRCSLTGRVHYD